MKRPGDYVRAQRPGPMRCRGCGRSVFRLRSGDARERLPERNPPRFSVRPVHRCAQLQLFAAGVAAQ